MDTRVIIPEHHRRALVVRISAFVWPHSASQFTNTWVMGIIVAAIAAIACTWPAIRYLNTLSAWLIISAFAMPAVTSGTRWNNFIVGVVVVVLSLADTNVADRPLEAHTRTA